MSELFGRAAQRLAGLAARALGWRAEEFWRATPMELASALAPPGNPDLPLDRATLNRMMEDDDGDLRHRPD